MTFAQGMVDVIEANAGLNALLGGAGVATRLFPMRLPQTVSGAVATPLPAIVYQRVSAPRRYTLDGGSRQVRARYQFSVWADDYLEAQQVGDALVAALSGYRATLTSGERVDVVKIENDVDDFEPDTGYSRRLVDAVWHYEET